LPEICVLIPEPSGQVHYGNAKVIDIRDDEFEFLIDGEIAIVPKLIKGE
jgi:hypothetical protein